MVIGYRETVKGRDILKVFSDCNLRELEAWGEAQGVPWSWLHGDHFDLWRSKAAAIRRRKAVWEIGTADGRHRHARFRRELRAEAHDL